MSKVDHESVKNGMDPIHPGVILKEEFLIPLGLSSSQLADIIKIPVVFTEEIISGQLSVCANTALRLSAALGTTSRFWLNLQMEYDVRIQEIADGDTISKEVQLIAALK